jgi:hypothetical protein
MATTTQTQNRYDHRLKELVRSTQDIRCALQQGVPPSTARGWLRAPTADVISIDVVQLDAINLQNEVLHSQNRSRNVSYNHHKRPTNRTQCKLSDDETLRSRYNDCKWKLLFKASTSVSWSHWWIQG